MTLSCTWKGLSGWKPRPMSSVAPCMSGITIKDDFTQKLTRLWEGLLGVHPIEPNQNYFDLGGDSLLAVQMFDQIDRMFQVKLPVATLFDAPTIADLVEILVYEPQNSPSPCLVAIQPKGSRPPFFCMHGAGGGVLIYRELSQHLGGDQPFYGLQSQAMDGSSEPQTRFEDMAIAYVREIRRIQPRGPYYLGGYCSGGTIAYEVAQQLHAKGEEIALLAMFDTLNWCKVPPLTPVKKVQMGVEKTIFHILNVARLDGSGKRDFLVGKIRDLRNRIPVWRGMLLDKVARGSAEGGFQSIAVGRIWAANDRAATDYVPKPYPGVVTDFRPLRQYSIHRQADLKWDQLAQRGQTIVRVPVYPAGMLVEPFVGVLAEALRKSIDSAMQSQRRV